MNHPSAQKYQTIRKLDQGGMAEVFLGQASTLAGFEKKVAIKRVLPQFTSNEKFIRMFLDEARLSLRLSHANIVSVFDVGVAADNYFIVMEYIDGVNLKAVLKKGPMPLPLAVYVVICVARALAWAHDMVDDDGSLLNVVHRDVSPPNILLSWRGEVKLTDFGLARAASQIESTDPGVVKGKFAYLSPEATNAIPVDARADIFSCGTVLWEAITGERLFKGKSDHATLLNVRNAKVPALAGSHDVPEELDRIIQQATAADPNDRYQNARDLGRDLSAFLVGQGWSTTEYDLAEWLGEHRQNEVSKERAKKKEEKKDEQVEEIDAALQHFETLDESLHISATYDVPEPQTDEHLLEDPRSWTVLGDEPNVTGEFASLVLPDEHAPTFEEEATTPRGDDSSTLQGELITGPHSSVNRNGGGNSTVSEVGSMPVSLRPQNEESDDVERSASAPIGYVAVAVAAFAAIVAALIFMMR